MKRYLLLAAVAVLLAVIATPASAGPAEKVTAGVLIQEANDGVAWTEFNAHEPGKGQFTWTRYEDMDAYLADATPQRTIVVDVTSTDVTGASACFTGSASYDSKSGELVGTSFTVAAVDDGEPNDADSVSWGWNTTDCSGLNDKPILAGNIKVHASA